MRKFLLFAFKIFFVLILLLLQISFISGFNIFAGRWQIFLSALIPILLLYEEKSEIIWWAAFFGLILGFYSFYPFFIVPILLIIIVFFVNFSLNNFFATRSWYSLIILSAITTIIYNVPLTAYKYFFDKSYFEATNILFSTFLVVILWQVLFNFLGGAAIFGFLKKIKN